MVSLASPQYQPIRMATSPDFHTSLSLPFPFYVFGSVFVADNLVNELVKQEISHIPDNMLCKRPKNGCRVVPQGVHLSPDPAYSPGTGDTVIY